MSKQTISRESSKAWNPQTTGWVWTQKTKQQGTCALETRADRINDHWNFWPRGDWRSCLFLALAWGLEEDFEKGRRLQEKQLWAVHHHNVGHLSHWSWWFSVGTMMPSAALSKCKPSRWGDIMTTWRDLPTGLKSILNQFSSSVNVNKKASLHESDRRNKWGRRSHNGQCKDSRWHSRRAISVPISPTLQCLTSSLKSDH